MSPAGTDEQFSTGKEKIIWSNIGRNASHGVIETQGEDEGDDFRAKNIEEEALESAPIAVLRGSRNGRRIRVEFDFQTVPAMCGVGIRKAYLPLPTGGRRP